MKAPATRRRGGGAKPKRESAAPVRRPVLSMVDFLEGELVDIEEALREAFKDGSWQAFATLKRQKRELFEGYVAAREAAAKADAGPKLDEEALVRQRIIPLLGRLPLPLVHELYQALGARLGQKVAQADEEVA